ncbi:hypothetical protein A3H53_01370 [Candidatus Nomurabacteria bacterium RIFCSPLOWO2_02_FULL_40_10]|uniref:Uncharacterized protein n=1 Tax=Candidatus Nomurabacteria bacterium RIFCSPLOWO2_02_FULL_40_10 TaxID=1801786 RepID=A0A1F6XZ52_9BACT|nr:MAG: hypothetical protein A3H53_01370 [Candidatus Nomurabacteria bacterium RIFCSPLOWO2_02_FULL_40_10]
MSNNSSLANVSDVVDVDRSPLKISIIIATAVLFAYLSSYFFRAGEVIYSPIFAALFLIVFVLQNLFIKSFNKLFLATLLEAIALSLPFYQSFSNYFVLAVLVLFVFLSKASFDSRRELEATIKVRFLRVAKLSLNPAIPTVILFLLVMLTIQGRVFTEEGIGTILRPLTPLMNRYAPTFLPSMPAGELLNDVVVANLGKEELSELNKLPSWAQKQLISKSVTQLAERVGSLIGGEIDLKESITTNLLKAMTSGYSGLNSTFKALLVIGFLILFYSLLRSLTVFIYAPLALFAFVFYELLLAFNFFVIQLESRSREVITLK